MPAVAFIMVENPSTSVFAESGHRLFLLRSVAKDPVKQTQFRPDEAAGSNPVERQSPVRAWQHWNDHPAASGG
ncbi:MAG: hypothetical protein IPL03_13640 [Sterolibacteriaceae bacterium]|nr:hypothetical protein [Candidatus Methylophosphatis haderslevensis]